MKQPIAALTVVLLSTLASVPTWAEAADYESTLTGDWGGARSSLAEAGVEAEIVYKADIMSNLSGGIDEGVSALDNLDVIFTFDGEKIVGAKGLSATVHFLNNFGDQFDADRVGSSQIVNNIEVPRPTGKLYQAFIQQNWMDDRVSVLAGLYDLNSEFYITDSSGVFMHATFGIGTDIAQSGQNAPSIFPFTSVGGRVRVAPSDDTYVQMAILDGVPGDVNDVHGTEIHFDKNDGWLVVAEAGYTPKEGTKLALGGWYYSESFDHLTHVGANGDPKRERSDGLYALAETRLYEESAGQGLDGFVRFGVANGAVNQFDYAWSTGLVYTGLIEGRDEGQLGFGITGAHNSNTFMNANPGLNSAETTFELTYSDMLTPWLTIQPDVQYVVNPGTNPARDDALVLGTRLSVNF